jgi:dephospho-CoA kinase
MRITIEKYLNKVGDKQTIRFVYWYGSKTDENGKTKHDRKRKHLNQYLYAKPETKAEEQHNKETLKLVEQIKDKQLSDYTKSQFGLIDIPMLFPETVAPDLIKLTLSIDIDQLTKELAKQGYQLVKANP